MNTTRILCHLACWFIVSCGAPPGSEAPDGDAHRRADSAVADMSGSSGDERGLAASSAGYAAQGPPSATIAMTDYWPTRALSRLYRVPGGRIYLKHVIEPVDRKASETYPSALQPRAGDVRYLLHDYFDRDGSNADATTWGDTWHMRNTPASGEVSEIADTFPMRNADDSADLTSCASPCYGRTAVYNDQVIGHGRPGGHRVGEAPYTNDDIRWWYSSSGSPPYDALSSEYGSWSETAVVALHETYTPAYGSPNNAGGFNAGAPPTYHDVIEVAFGHGNRVAPRNEHPCANYPVGLMHRPGFSSFWQRLWLAPAVGIIVIDNVFHEGYCDGSALHPGDGPGGAWLAYLDRLEEGAAVGPPQVYPPSCPTTQRVTNTCAEVGYPANYVGSYVSERTQECGAGNYGDWVRYDTCEAPAATCPTTQTVTNTCAEVGYPGNCVGSYVSERTIACGATEYGDWVRYDSCRPP